MRFELFRGKFNIHRMILRYQISDLKYQKDKPTLKMIPAFIFEIHNEFDNAQCPMNDIMDTCAFIH
jgi:hypothetical protein